MTAQMLAERLGGPAVLRSEVRSDLDIAELIHQGLPLRVVDVVLASGLLRADELYTLVVPRRTLAHRREKQHALSPEQSDRLARVVRVMARAEEALGSPDRATHWMRKENRALAGKRPIDLLESDAGTRMVERVLGRIEHGVYS
ncbi:MAG TPA: antitoxin Xre/MbcA/ParS toxin-binding domain-containing protein [Longimicrobium sp.]|nr:antitoxin Xre/MbcA/ParS toxin-binding domain-containing protein [Longimicrobium sp.]